MQTIAISMIIRGVSSALLFWLGLRGTGSLIWACVGLFAAWITVLFGFDIPRTIRYLRLLQHGPFFPNWEPSTILRIAKGALPLGIVMCIISLNTNIPRYIIEHTLGTYNLGIYSALTSLSLAATTVITAIGQSATPRLARSFISGNLANFTGLFILLLSVATLTGLGGLGFAVIWGSPLLALIFGLDYARTDIFIPVMLAAALGYLQSVCGYALTSCAAYKPQVYIQVLGAIATASICIRAVSIDGVAGVAYGVAAANAGMTLASLGVIGLRALRQRKLYCV